jgi:hypothetical protein
MLMLTSDFKEPPLSVSEAHVVPPSWSKEADIRPYFVRTDISLFRLLRKDTFIHIYTSMMRMVHVERTE